MRYQGQILEFFGKILLMSTTVACGVQHETPASGGAALAGLLRGARSHNSEMITQTDSTSVQEELALDSENATSKEKILAIPPRLQWNNGHGYCGETSIQAIGLYYGAWISQQIVRQVGGGEILLGVNIDDALKALNFDFTSWDYDHQKTPQFNQFAVWMKRYLWADIPVIFAEFLADEEDSEYYDHIVPATGIKLQGSNVDEFNAKDVLVFANNFRKTNFNLTFKQLKATRKQCKKDLYAGGCIPQEVDYGVAIKGISDALKVTKPARLEVDAPDEPNVSLGEAPRQMQAKLVISALTKGQKYAILRFNDYQKVPTGGDEAHFLASGFAVRTDFQAAAERFTFEDPQTFGSNESIYYRVIALP